MHYTNLAGYNAIGSQVDWFFRAHQPPGSHPRGAYFTTLSPSTVSAKRLGISRSKLEYYFHFRTCIEEAYEPLRGGRGRYIFFSRKDITVPVERQILKGETGL